jgi:hypothetical protein
VWFNGGSRHARTRESQKRRGCAFARLSASLLRLVSNLSIRLCFKQSPVPASLILLNKLSQSVETAVLGRPPACAKLTAASATARVAVAEAVANVARGALANGDIIDKGAVGINCAVGVPAFLYQPRVKGRARQGSKRGAGWWSQGTQTEAACRAPMYIPVPSVIFRGTHMRAATGLRDVLACCPAEMEGAGGQ